MRHLLTTPFSSQQDPDIPENDYHHTVPVKKKMLKRKRIRSSKPHPKNNQKIIKQAPAGAKVTSANAEGSSARVCQLVQSRAATSYVPNAVLKINLKSTLSKLSAANSTTVDQDKKLSAMSKKTKDLTESVLRSRAATKEARSAVAAAARDADTKLKNVQATVAASVELVEVELKKLHAIINEKGSELQTQKQQFECHLKSAVTTAVDKERVCLQNISIYFLFTFMFTYFHCQLFIYRNGQQELYWLWRKKSASKLSRTLNDHAMEIENKNKEIKVKCNAC